MAPLGMRGPFCYLANCFDAWYWVHHWAAFPRRPKCLLPYVRSFRHAISDKALAPSPHNLPLIECRLVVRRPLLRYIRHACKHAFRYAFADAKFIVVELLRHARHACTPQVFPDGAQDFLLCPSAPLSRASLPGTLAITLSSTLSQTPSFKLTDFGFRYSDFLRISAFGLRILNHPVEKTAATNSY
jgi:hypothetical protein